MLLDAARDVYGYDYRRTATGYLVLPATIQTRIFHLNYLDVERYGTSKTRISSGQGRTTCGWWIDQGKRILFSSTHGSDPACPTEPDFSHGYVWPVYPYDIYEADATTGKVEKRLTDSPGYDAESTIEV